MIQENVQLLPLKITDLIIVISAGVTRLIARCIKQQPALFVIRTIKQLTTGMINKQGHSMTIDTLINAGLIGVVFHTASNTKCGHHTDVMSNSMEYSIIVIITLSQWLMLIVFVVLKISQLSLNGLSCTVFSV